MRALVTAPGRTAVVEDVPRPIPAPSEILVAVKAVAINPVDALADCWKRVVVAWGNNVTKFRGGESVAGFVHGACTENTLPGAFAEFVVIDASLVYQVPENITPTQAATVPLCFMTAAQALHLRLGLPFMGPMVTFDALIGINGASSSVGQYAVQLARLSGCKVFGTASESNSGLIHSLGADATVDYRSPDYSDLLSEAASSLFPARLTLGLDCIAEGPTTKRLTDAFAPEGGRCIVLRSTAWRVPFLRSDVEFLYTAVWSMLGVDFTYNHGTTFPASPSDYAHAQAMYSSLPELLASGAIKPNRVRLMEGGLDAIMDGLEWIGGGDVSTRKSTKQKPLSAEKLVYIL